MVPGFSKLCKTRSWCTVHGILYIQKINFILLIMLYWDYLYEVQQLGVAVLLFKRTLISH
jgi:hypothetical protein